MIDEYQDTNLLQARIIDFLGSRDQIMAVGDDAQSIYSWRGANYENILRFPDRHRNTKIFRIETNYRSTPEILRFANGVINQFHPGQGFHKTLYPSRKQRQRPQVIQVWGRP